MAWQFFCDLAAREGVETLASIGAQSVAGEGLHRLLVVERPLTDDVEAGAAEEVVCYQLPTAKPLPSTNGSESDKEQQNSQ